MNRIPKGTLLAGAGVAAVVALGTWGVLTVTDDPDRQVDTVDLGAVAAPEEPSSGSSGSSGDSGRSGGSDRSVVELEALSGRATRPGDDVDDLAVDGVELDFGPDEWVVGAPATEDFDGDGEAEALVDEIEGLVGQRVELLVRYDDDGERDDADVYEINGLRFRDPGGPAPWEPDESVELATEDEVRAAATAAVGDGARVVEIERDDDDDDGLLWEVEVLDAEGREHNVLVDAAGEVVGQSLDD